MQTIVITGPESSGKTTLARQLAEHFGTAWVPEFARDYLEALGRDYSKDDLLEIAKGQLAAESAFAKLRKEPLFIDTSLEVLKIWSVFRFGECHPWILENLRQQKHSLYLLCRPDLPWEPDPLRENPDDQAALFELYCTELTALNVNFVEIEGVGKDRMENALHAISHFQKLIIANQ